MSESIRQVFEYHEASKHHFHKYARGPGYLDWASQPDPFRRYHGAPLKRLERIGSGDDPGYEDAFISGRIPSATLNFQTISQLFFDSLALSAWKRAGTETWALRVNPSSGNLHPTEGYLVGGPLPGLWETPLVCHYAPREHALELRTRLPAPIRQKVTAGMPQETVLMGLTSIYWREAWKYGERAYRYCMHDIGHAIGAISVAAAGLGWKAMLLDDLSSEQIGGLLGIHDPGSAEAERPDCILAIYPGQSGSSGHHPIDPDVIAAIDDLTWHGKPNLLSSSHMDWPAIELVSKACEKPVTRNIYDAFSHPLSIGDQETGARLLSLRRIVHQRRSAVAMDGFSSVSREIFYRMLAKASAGFWVEPFRTLPWTPCVHPALFVHRVDGLMPGLYFLVRDARQKEELQASMNSSFVWRKPEECPDSLDLYLLAEGDVRRPSMQIACFQDIASDGCFSMGMIAQFKDPLKRYGSWFYPRLFWECGMIGQLLYLEAEAAGLRATGIGCYFDNPMHDLLGLKDARYQDLYHFTVGGPIEDTRLTTLPAYYHLSG